MFLGTSESRVTAILLIIQRSIEGQKVSLESEEKQQTGTSSAGATVGRSKRIRHAIHDEINLNPLSKRVKQERVTAPINTIAATLVRPQTKGLPELTGPPSESMFLRHAVTLT